MKPVGLREVPRVVTGPRVGRAAPGGGDDVVRPVAGEGAVLASTVSKGDSQGQRRGLGPSRRLRDHRPPLAVVRGLSRPPGARRRGPY